MSPPLPSPCPCPLQLASPLSGSLHPTFLPLSFLPAFILWVLPDTFRRTFHMFFHSFMWLQCPGCSSSVEVTRTPSSPALMRLMVPWDTDTDHLQIHTNELHNYKWRKSTWRRACTWAMSFGLQSKENELDGVLCRGV